MIEQMEDIMEACDGGQAETIVSHVLIDEAWKDVEVFGPACAEATGKLGGDFRKLLTIPKGARPVERWSDDDLQPRS